MRLLQLPTGRGELIDLHPNMTVVQGLDESSHRRLVDAVTGLARGQSAVDGGLVEAHGVLFELRADLLAVLEVAADDLDPVVRAKDLPTQPLTVDARELRQREQEFAQLLARIADQAELQSQARSAVSAAVAALEQARQARADAETRGPARIEEVDRLTRRLDHLAELRRRLDEQLAGLEQEVAAAEAHRQGVEQRTARVRDAARAATARLGVVAAERDAARAECDPGAAAAMEQAAADLRELTAAIEAERAAASAESTVVEAAIEQGAPPEEALERLDSRLAAIDRMLVALAATDPTEITESLTLLRGGDSVERVPSTEALALADELDAIGTELDEDITEPLAERSLASARERLDDARQALLEATQAVRNPALDRDEVERLEDAHDALLQAIDKADGRFAGNRARERVIALRAAEQEVLDRLGFASYSDYMMGTSFLEVDPVKEAALEAARTELNEAEDEWHRIERATDEALERAAALDRRRGLIERARALLGGPVPVRELAGALRDLRVPVVSAEASAARLRRALEDAGLDLGDEDVDAAELTMMADAWLSEIEHADERRREAERERDAIQEEQRALRADLAAAADEAARRAAAPDPEVVREERLASARARVEDAEQRWLVAETAAERLPELEAAVAAAATDATTAQAAAAGAEEELQAAQEAVDATRDRHGSLRHEIEGAAATEAEVTASIEALAADRSLDPEVLDAAIEAARVQLREAEDAVEAESRALALLDTEGQAAAIEIERLQDIVVAQDTGTATEAEELEWYLLARLAAQRAVSVAGSLPLLLDDALRGLDGEGVSHLLGRLERMAEAVQVIVISEDPLVAAWATEAGSARAAVVRPGVP